MAELSIKLQAVAEVTNMSDIKKVFDNLGGVGDDVKNALMKALKEDKPIEIKLGDKSTIMELMFSIRDIVERNNFMIKGGLFGGATGAVMGGDVRKRLGTTKSRVMGVGDKEQITKMFGGDALNFLDEVTAMSYNPKGENQAAWGQKFSRATNIISKIEAMLNAFEKGEKVPRTEGGKSYRDIVKQSMKADMYKGHIDKAISNMMIGYMEAMTGTDLDMSRIVGAADLTQIKGRGSGKEMAKAVAQDWTLGKAMLERLVQGFDMDADELLDIPAVKDMFEGMFKEEVSMRTTMAKAHPQAKKSAIATLFPEVQEEFLESMLEGKGLETVISTATTPLISSAPTSAQIEASTINPFGEETMTNISNLISKDVVDGVSDKLGKVIDEEFSRRGVGDILNMLSKAEVTQRKLVTTIDNWSKAETSKWDQLNERIETGEKLTDLRTYPKD